MSEVKKRGRPRKNVVAEAKIPSGAAEKTPTLALKASSPKLASVATSISKSVDEGDGIEKLTRGRKKSSESKEVKPKTTRKRATKSDSAEASTPAVVATLVAAEESKILEEVAKTATKKTSRKTVKQAEKPVLPEVSVAEVVPPLKEQSPTAPSIASHLQPTNTLAMGLPIPTYQSTMHTVGLHASHCLPWLPNPPTLPQAAHFSSTTRLLAPNSSSSRRKLPSLKEANRFAVTGESSRGGPGSGAAKSRAQQAAEDARGARPELLQPGEMPAKYKPAMRRVQAIIVALPIVIVTSYMLYERCKCFPLLWC